MSACATPALAQLQACYPRATLLSHLAKKYQEAPIAGGITNQGGLVEVLADPKSNTWTIIVTTPQGMSCLVAAGEGWRTLTPGPHLGPGI